MHLFKEDLQTLLKRTRYEHKRVHAKDNSIMITALPKMTKPSRWINMANRLNYLNPNTTNNHEQQIYRFSRVVGNRQANEKMLGCVQCWPPERTSSKSAEAE
jgi:hypothetical protein